MVLADSRHLDLNVCELCHEKTCLCMGFQTRSDTNPEHGSTLEILDFGNRENKDADQLLYHAADQRLCFRYIDTFYDRNFKPLSIFCTRTDQFFLHPR